MGGKMVPIRDSAMPKPGRRVTLQSGATAFLLAWAALLIGCDPPLDPEQYGQIVNDVPQVEGADKPYPLPQLDEPTKTDEPAQK
jgi:hypothetical protein